MGPRGPSPSETPEPERARSVMPDRLEAITLYLRGALMGFADVIPGVSGGTVALVVGVYERLIGALHALFAVPGRFIHAGPREGWKALGAVPWAFLLALGSGIASALVIGAFLILGVYERWEVQARALFFGLILGSLAVPWHRIHVQRPALFVVAGAAALVAFLLVGVPQRETTDPSFVLVMGGAMVAITAMVLPGVSGAYLLHVFGLYLPTLEAVRGVDVGYLGVFALGALVGAVFIVHVISWLLQRVHDVTLAALVGLMLGGLRALWPWVEESRGNVLPEWDAGVLWVPILLLVAGFLFVRLVDRWGRARMPDERSSL